MNSTPNDPHPDTSEDENPTERPNAAADTSDGLADPETAEQFHQAVEHRLSESTPADPDVEEQGLKAEPDEDNPVTVDNPE
ncbi:UNVERIFIED_CONTAM: hypothetical protein RF653_14945 [Kocuria sp. CPCC 205316]|uniref:hypothetical protein n=1 Tax=Kocuria TaxID=57493 RepID=UPI0036DB43FC